MKALFRRLGVSRRLRVTATHNFSLDHRQHKIGVSLCVCVYGRIPPSSKANNYVIQKRNSGYFLEWQLYLHLFGISAHLSQKALSPTFRSGSKVSFYSLNEQPQSLSFLFFPFFLGLMSFSHFHRGCSARGSLSLCEIKMLICESLKSPYGEAI